MEEGRKFPWKGSLVTAPHTEPRQENLPLAPPCPGGAGGGFDASGEPLGAHPGTLSPPYVLAQTSQRCGDAPTSALPGAPRPRQAPHGSCCVLGSAALPQLHPVARGLVAWSRAEKSLVKPSESFGVLTGVHHGTARSGIISSRHEQGLGWAGRGGAGCPTAPFP